MEHLIANTMSLDGDWQIIYDDDNKGKLLGWQESDKFYQWYGVENIPVPSCWEQFRQDYEGVAWYGKKFRIPEDWAEQKIRLQFEAVNYLSEVYLNGTPVGFHEGGYTGFEFEIDDLLKLGEENFLAVRVIGPIITKDVVIDGLGRDEMPHWRGAIAGGIWQSVNLLATGHVYIKRAFVQPAVATGSIQIELEMENSLLTKKAMSVSCKVIPWRSEEETVAELIRELDFEPGEQDFQDKIVIPHVHLWSPDDPFLYILRAELYDGDDMVEAVSVRFGMREFTVDGKHFVLNGESIYLKAVFYEGLYPHTLAYPGDMEIVRKEMMLAKEAGINMIRPWRKQQPKKIYELADELGLLFVGAIPVECMNYWPKVTPYLEKRVMNEVEQMVLRDRNHPSIVMWEMFNEIARYPLKRMKHKVSLFARKLDPTRVIIDESGGFAGGANVYLPYGKEPLKFNDVHSYPGVPLNGKEYDAFLALGKTPEQLKQMGIDQPKHTASKLQPGLLTNITEIGCGSIPNLEDNVAQYEAEGNPLTPDYRTHVRLLKSYKDALRRSGADRIYPDFADFCKECQHVHAIANKLMTEAARINPDVAGIGIHAFTDGDWVLGAGLLDMFRNPKEAYYAAKEIFQPLYVAIRTNKPNIYDTEGIGIKLTSVNEKEAFDGKLTLVIQDSASKTVFEKEQRIKVMQGIGEIGIFDVRTEGWRGAYTIKATLEKIGGSFAIKNEYSFYVIDERMPQVPKLPIALAGRSDNLIRFMQDRHSEIRDFDADQSTDIPVVVAGSINEEDEIYRKMQSWVERGGTAVFLDLPNYPMHNDRIANKKYLIGAGNLLPFELALTNAKGAWTPASHIVKEHPVFAGLPVNCMMGEPYQNVYPLRAMIAPNSDWIVGYIGYSWNRGMLHKQNYLGVSNAYDAAELIEVAHGNGRYILSTLRLTEQLGKDPCADTIFTNLLQWVCAKRS